MRQPLLACFGCLAVVGCTTNFDLLFVGCPAGRFDCNGDRADGCEAASPCSGGPGGGGSGASGGAGGSAAPGQALWSVRIGGIGDERTRGVAVDGDGNVVVTGWFGDSITFPDGTTEPASGSLDILVVKLDADGNFVWGERFGGPGADAARGVACDDAGNVYLTGYFDDTIDLGGTPLTSNGDREAFVAKLDPDGNHVWSSRLGGPDGPQFGQTIAVRGDRVVVGGSAGGVAELGEDVVVAAYDLDGTQLWVQSWGGPSFDHARSVAIDSAGNAVVSGHFAETIDFGGGPLSLDDTLNVFVLKLDPAGGHIWSVGYGAAAEFPEGNTVGLSADDAIVVAGEFIGDINFGGGTFSSADPAATDLYVWKLTPDGNFVYAQRFGDEAFESGEALAVGADGTVFLGGYHEGTVDFGGDPLASTGKADVYFARFTSALQHVHSHQYGDPNEQHAHGLAIAPTGHVIATGCIYGAFATIDFGAGTLEGAGEFDGWVAKLAP